MRSQRSLRVKFGMVASEAIEGDGGVWRILWPSADPGRWWRLSLVPPIGLLLVALLLYPVVEDPTVMHAEGGFIESSQAALWGGCIVAAGMLMRRTRGLTRRAVLWRGVIAMPALAREFDLQEMLNPEAFGPWGVHYRLDWWTDLSEPFLVKLAWAIVGVLAGLALVVPIAAARPEPQRQLRAGHPAAWLTLAGFVMLGMGWVLDDLLRDMLPKLRPTWVRS